MAGASMRSAFVLALVVAVAGCGGDSSTSPTQSSLIQGSTALGIGQLAVVTFTVNRAGLVNTRADWNSSTNDIDTVIFRGRCTVNQVVTSAPGCGESAAAAIDASLNKPSLLSPSLTTGDYTFVVANWGPGADSSSYRIDGAVSGASAPAMSPAQVQRTASFPFALNGTTRASVIVGPVTAGPGPIQVTVDYAGSYNIQACVGPASGCKPMGGTPGFTGTFNIPADFSPGNIQASVYFNPNVAQPAGNPTGTVTFRYYSN